MIEEVDCDSELALAVETPNEYLDQQCMAELHRSTGPQVYGSQKHAGGSHGAHDPHRPQTLF